MGTHPAHPSPTAKRGQHSGGTTISHHSELSPTSLSYPTPHGSRLWDAVKLGSSAILSLKDEHLGLASSPAVPSPLATEWSKHPLPGR